MEYEALIQRIVLASRSPNETFGTLPESEQDAWRTFFVAYGKEVMHLTDEELFKIGGCLSQIWAISHEYHRLFGPIWK